MTEESGKSVTEETRPALGDLTNLPKKRGISSVLGDLVHKSEDESGKTVANEDTGVKFSKRLCLVVDDLVKENDTNEGSSSDDKNSSGDSYDKESEESMVEISRGKEIYFEPGDRDGALVLTPDQTQTDVVVVTGESVLSSSNAERRNPMVIGEELRSSRSLRSFELRKCSNVNKKEHVNQDLGDDMLKSCSCSFCLKAAYIWSDLHYQDMKGQLSALKKSQKEASKLIQMHGKEKHTDFLAPVSSINSAKLESDLMGQWRSLFLSMGDILAHESNTLQNSFLTMKELREDCKIDLERATKTPQHNN